MKFNDTLMNIVKKNLEAGTIPMLLGEPGIGKSSWVIKLGELMHTKVFVLPCNQLADKADLTGSRLVPDENGSYEQRFYPHTVINQAIAYAKDNPREFPILFLDELNRTTPDVTSEALSIPTLRSIGDVPLPDNLRVMTAGNDKGNITSLDSASITRFVLYHVEPDVTTFINLDASLNPFIKNTLMKHPETILCKEVQQVFGNTNDDDDNDDNDNSALLEATILDDAEQMSQMATPRTIAGLSRWLNLFDNQEIMAMLADTYVINNEETNTLKECIEGHTGRTAFTACLLQEIAANIMSTTNQSNAQAVPKPMSYDNLKTCPDIASLETYIQSLSDNDKSGCLVYALYEKQDNAKIIHTLLDNMTDLTPADNKEIMKLYATDALDEMNKEVFLQVDSPISKRFSIFMES